MLDLELPSSDSGVELPASDDGLDYPVKKPIDKKKRGRPKSAQYLIHNVLVGTNNASPMKTKRATRSKQFNH